MEKRIFEITIYFYEAENRTFIKKTIETTSNRYVSKKIDFYQDFYKSDLVTCEEIKA